VADPSRSVTVVAVFTSKAKTIIMGSEGKISGHSVRAKLQSCVSLRRGARLNSAEALHPMCRRARDDYACRRH
jgi:hypothetical protein